MACVMLDLLGIALVAYLIGSSIEGVNTYRHLSHSLPELVKGTEADPESAGQPRKHGLVLVIITGVSIAGGFSWPCRLIHRSMKAVQGSLDD